MTEDAFSRTNRAKVTVFHLVSSFRERERDATSVTAKAATFTRRRTAHYFMFSKATRIKDRVGSERKIKLCVQRQRDIKSADC